MQSAYARIPPYRYGLATFGVAAGHAEALCGAALNSLVLLTVTFMTEAKMLRCGRRPAPRWDGGQGGPPTTPSRVATPSMP
tara:strand:+ start:580 stop:822 length:243 start_codon:yes stop_codon:yes gene_type:complete